MSTVKHTRRSTPLHARGEPMLWLTGMAMGVCILMIVVLLSMTFVQGGRAFWPKPIHLVTLHAGDGGEAELFLGRPIREEAFTPTPEQRERIDRVEAGGALFDGARDSDGNHIRRLYQTANRDVTGVGFRWVALFEVRDIGLPEEAVFVERYSEWGPWLGYPERLLEYPEGWGVEGGGREGVEPEVLAEGASETLEVLPGVLERSREAQRRIRSIDRSEIGSVNAQIERARLKLAQTRLDAERAAQGGGAALSVALFVVVVLGALALAGVGVCGVVGVWRGRMVRGFAVGCLMTACLLALLAALEHPWSAGVYTQEDLRIAEAEHDAEIERLNAAYGEIIARRDAIDGGDKRLRVRIVDPASGRFAPLSHTEPDEPMRVSEIARVVPANTLSFWDKLGVYWSRWWEYVSEEPRSNNTAGGIYPVIFGTVLLTILLSVSVVPLGVIAALYIREYATQGIVISVVRIAVNNLAGVPSIVYGVFGLGFFCYIVGAYVDEGPAGAFSEGAVLPRGPWWALAVGLFALVGIALVIAGSARKGASASSSVWLARGCVAVWALAACAAVTLIATTPYFHGFFEARAPSPTFGTRGMLWASLTLALLTLPVVIVATEEAISAVPRSMREGSYGCGASKWQTIRRIVLPRAMPGIMTGTILAMARGAGEVAPIMLVGAVKSASELPLSTEPPFFHLERSFMHLGFHIYDLGFQSPDAQAARPLVWTTTLVLILIVLVLNLSAIRIRSSLRKRFVGDTF